MSKDGLLRWRDAESGPLRVTETLRLGKPAEGFIPAILMLGVLEDI